MEALPLEAVTSGPCILLSLCIRKGEMENHILVLRCFLLVMTRATSACSLLPRASHVVPPNCKRAGNVGEQSIHDE